MLRRLLGLFFIPVAAAGLLAADAGTPLVDA